MKSKIALVAVAVFAALSLSACNSDDTSQSGCILVNDVNGSSPTTTCQPTNRRLTTIAVTTTTQSAATTTQPTTTTTTASTTTTTTTSVTPTPTPSTVTVVITPPTTTTTTTTVAPPPPVQPKFNGYVNVGQAASCGGSRIESVDSGGITFGKVANAVFRSNGFSLTPVSYPEPGNPPFMFYGVIVERLGNDTPYDGNVLLAQDGNFLTSANASNGDFWLNSGFTAEAFVFCDSPPFLR